MRYFRRLPPFLRVASIAGWLFGLSAIALLAVSLVTLLSSSHSHLDPDSGRLTIIAANLLLLAQTCTFVVNSYTTRFHRPDRAPFPLDSWQSQVRAIALLSVLPLCAIVLVLVIPFASIAFLVVDMPIFALAAVMVVVAQIVGAASSGPMHPPPPG